MAQKPTYQNKFNERRNKFMNKELQHKSARDFERFVKSLANRLGKAEHILIDDLVVTRGEYSDQFHFSSLFNGWGTYLEFTLSFPPIDKEYLSTINELFLGVTVSDEAISALLNRIMDKLSDEIHSLEYTIARYSNYIASYKESH